MDIMEVSILHHMAIVLAALCFAVSMGWSHPVIFFLALLYLYAVNERYSMRLRRRLQYEERKGANQRRLLSDTESVRWLNHAVEKIWPICIERIASQQFLMPIVPWFLERFKPWTAKKAVLQNLYLGRNPPIFTDIRVLRQSADDDHLVLELGMNFLSGDDMNAVLAVQLRKRLGFGITANMHVTGMHIEGKVLVGVKFLRDWPFIARVRVCFVEPPYFQMTVKPIFGHGLDVTELPGISGWLDKLLDVAFSQTLVEPNMLVIDVEKFVSAPTEGWFTVDEKRPVAHVKVEILEGADMKPSDLNGLADPYVKGRLGPYRFQTKIHKKTLTPKWFEEFKIPITSWEACNLLFLQVCDKDPIFDDLLGDCSIDIGSLRGGQRHDKWISLKNIKMGRIHIAMTVLEDEPEEGRKASDNNQEESFGPNETTEPTFDQKNIKTGEQDYRKMTDEFEPINIEGQERTGIWVHHPGSEVSQTWEPRKGRARFPETQLHKETDKESPRSSTSESHKNNTSNDGDCGKNHKHGKIRRGIGKIGTLFHKSPRKESQSDESPVETPRPNIQPLGEKRISINLVVEKVSKGGDEECGYVDSEECKMETSPERGSLKGKVKEMAKERGKTALKNVFSRKGLDKMKGEERLGDDEMDESNLFSGEMREDPLLVGSSPVDVRKSVASDQ